MQKIETAYKQHHNNNVCRDNYVCTINYLKKKIYSQKLGGADKDSDELSLLIRVELFCSSIASSNNLKIEDSKKSLSTIATR